LYIFLAFFLTFTLSPSFPYFLFSLHTSSICLSLSHSLFNISCSFLSPFFHFIFCSFPP
jgi:hypothetical protein